MAEAGQRAHDEFSAERAKVAELQQDIGYRDKRIAELSQALSQQSQRLASLSDELAHHVRRGKIMDYAHDVAQAQINKLSDERDRMREYAQHKSSCQTFHWGSIGL